MVICLRYFIRTHYHLSLSSACSGNLLEIFYTHAFSCDNLLRPRQVEPSSKLPLLLSFAEQTSRNKRCNAPPKMYAGAFWSALRLRELCLPADVGIVVGSVAVPVIMTTIVCSNLTMATLLRSWKKYFTAI